MNEGSRYCVPVLMVMILMIPLYDPVVSDALGEKMETYVTYRDINSLFVRRDSQGYNNVIWEDETYINYARLDDEGRTVGYHRYKLSESYRKIHVVGVVVDSRDIIHVFHGEDHDQVYHRKIRTDGKEISSPERVVGGSLSGGGQYYDEIFVSIGDDDTIYYSLINEGRNNCNIIGIASDGSDISPDLVVSSGVMYFNRTSESTGHVSTLKAGFYCYVTDDAGVSQRTMKWAFPDGENNLHYLMDWMDEYILHLRYKPDGTLLTDEYLQFTEGSSPYPWSVELGDNGNLHVLVRLYEGDADLSYSQMSPDGTTVAGPVSITTAHVTAGSTYRAAMAPHDGGSCIVWANKAPQGEFRLGFAFIDESGEFTTEPLVIEVPVEEGSLDDSLCTTGVVLTAIVGVLVIVAAIMHKQKGKVKE